MIGGRVFDTSAVIDFATGRTRYAQAVVWSSVEMGIVVLVPLSCLTIALARIPVRRHEVVNVLLDLPVTVLAGISRTTAPHIAETLRPAKGQAHATLGAAHSVCCARTRGWPILTGEPAPLRALWKEAMIEVLP